MDDKSKQEIESAVSEVMAKFLKEEMGEQAKSIITQVKDDTIIVRFKEIAPPAERNLAKDQEGMKLIKELKEKLIERVKQLLQEMIEKITKTEVIEIHSTFSVETGERIEIITLGKNLEKLTEN